MKTHKCTLDYAGYPLEGSEVCEREGRRVLYNAHNAVYLQVSGIEVKFSVTDEGESLLQAAGFLEERVRMHQKASSAV